MVTEVFLLGYIKTTAELMPSQLCFEHGMS